MACRTEEMSAARAALNREIARGERRRAFAARLRRRVEALGPRGPRDALAGLHHLADLYQHCDRYYPDVAERPEDLLPFNWRRHVGTGPMSLGSSPAAMCAEG